MWKVRRRSLALPVSNGVNPLLLLSTLSTFCHEVATRELFRLLASETISECHFCSTIMNVLSESKSLPFSLRKTQQHSRLLWLYPAYTIASATESTRQQSHGLFVDEVLLVSWPRIWVRLRVVVELWARGLVGSWAFRSKGIGEVVLTFGFDFSIQKSMPERRWSPVFCSSVFCTAVSSFG